MTVKNCKNIALKGLTMMEMIISLAIIAVLFAVMLPQFKNIQNSWASKQATAEALQNGRILIDRLSRDLAKAAQITAVSDPCDTTGYIEFVGNDAITYRYEIGADNIVEFGPVGTLSDLAGPVSQLQFTCFDAQDLDTPITTVGDIRCVKVQTTLTNTGHGQDQTFTASAYLRTNVASQGITQGISSSFGITTGNTPALATIDATHYLCAYTGPGDDGWATVLTVDTASSTVSTEVPFEYDTVGGKYAALARIDTTHYLCAYTGPGNDGWAVVLEIEPFNWTISCGTALEFDSTLGFTPAIEKIDAEHYLCAYTGPGSNGWAVVLNVNPMTWTVSMGTPFEFDAVNGEAPALSKINDSHYLCAYQGALNDGWAVVLTVDTGDWSISKETPFEFDTINGLTPALCKINDTHYLCAYTGQDDDGWAVVLTVNMGSWIISKGTPFEFDSADGSSPALVQMAGGSRYLCSYVGPFVYLWVTVLVVDTDVWDISQESTAMLTSVKALQPDLVQIDDKNHLCAYEDRTNDGWVMILNVGGELRP